jgi:3-deoxy-D-manno-octulosonic-acid transferase
VFLLYNILLTLFSPIWVPWMLWRSWRRKEKPNWRERTGDVPLIGKNAPPRIWFHAVSVGEVIASKPILREIKALLPDHQLILSVTTSSGHQTARELVPAPFDALVYFPIDVARFQLVAMQKVRPKAVVIMETELWMNFLWAAKVFDAKTILVSGRISDRSFPRSMKVRFFYHALLQFLDKALMQSEVDAERILALGAKSAEVMGSSKFDEATDGLLADGHEWRAKLKIPLSAFVIVVGSTRGESEEEFVMEAINHIWEMGVWVVHAPRHIESVPALLDRAKRKFGTAALYSSHEECRYLVVDEYGVLAQIYSAADVAIVGGGFDNLGGQNMFQPLGQGKPVLHGPHMQNFREVAAMADRSGAAIACSTPTELGEKLALLAEEPEMRREMGQKAEELVRQNVGASRRYAEAIRDALKS